MSARTRSVLTGAAGMVLAAGLWWSWGDARLLVLNNAMRVSYPASRSMGALAAAAAALSLAMLTTRWWRLASALTVLVALGLAGQRVTYRLEASNDALMSRSFGVTTVLPWREIGQVNVAANGGFVVTAGDRRIAMSTGLPADEAAIVSRTVARRVREATARPVAR